MSRQEYGPYPNSDSAREQDNSRRGARNVIRLAAHQRILALKEMTPREQASLGLAALITVVGGVMAERYVASDPPLIDLEGKHRVYVTDEGDTVREIIGKAYPASPDFFEMSEKEQIEAVTEADEGAAAILEITEDLPGDPAYDEELPAGLEIPFPLNAKAGVVVNPQSGE